MSFLSWMWWRNAKSKKHKPNLRPLFFVASDGPPPARMVVIAGQIGIGTGLKMLVADAANQAIRHCRIGMVYPKPKGMRDERLPR